MQFDKKFKELSKFVQVILLLVPGVNLVVGILVRVSAVIRKKSGKNILGLILCLLSVGFLGLIDLISVLVSGNLCLVE